MKMFILTAALLLALCLCLYCVSTLAATEAGHVLVRLAAQTEVLEREAVAELVGAEGEEAPYALVPIAVNADVMYS